jgi:excisionase family DNA binding protein
MRPNTRLDRTAAQDRLLLRVEEAARLLSIGTTLTYELVGRGVLPHVRLGRAVRVPRAALEEWIASNTRGSTVGHRDIDDSVDFSQ